MKRHFTRRDFIKLSSLASAAFLTKPLSALSVSDPYKSRHGKSQKVIILGAGMAGLSAGIELQKLGHQVQIMEGQMRAGGRVFTARGMFADGLYADVGAARIPENHEWTMKYIKAYDLKLAPFSPSAQDSLHVINGKRIRYSNSQPAALSDYPVSLTSKEIQMGWEGISTKPFEALMSSVGNPADLSWPPKSIAHFDKMSFKEYLINQKYSPAIADILMLGWEKKEGLDLSILELFREYNLSFAATRYKIIGGNDLLPQAMANELGSIIQYGVKVIDVEQDEGGVNVTVVKGGERSSLRADRIVSTFSLPILRQMNFVKKLSAQKQRAINEMPTWNLSRTVLQVSDRYWRKEGLNGSAATDQPCEIWDPLYESNSKRGLISAYLKHDDSQLFMKMSDQERLNFSSKHVNTVFPGLNNYVEGGYTKCWGEDPWAKCASVVGYRNTMVNLLPHLITAEGRIHFAGEHASAYHGWIQGAIESGNRTAKEIDSF